MDSTINPNIEAKRTYRESVKCTVSLTTSIFSNGFLCSSGKSAKRAISLEAAETELNICRASAVPERDIILTTKIVTPYHPPSQEFAYIARKISAPKIPATKVLACLLELSG